MAKAPNTTTAPTGQIAPFGLRMLPELKERLEMAAKASGRSMNAEIISRLQASFNQAEQPAVDWRLRVDVRANEVRMETLRGHLYTVRMHADILALRLQSLKKEGADASAYDETAKNLANAQRDVVELEKQLDALFEESIRLARQYAGESRVVNEQIDAVVDKSLQAEYGKVHAMEVAMNVPLDLRQIKTNPSVGKVDEKPATGPTRSPNARKLIPKK